MQIKTALSLPVLSDNDYPHNDKWRLMSALKETAVGREVMKPLQEAVWNFLTELMLEYHVCIPKSLSQHTTEMIRVHTVIAVLPTLTKM